MLILPKSKHPAGIDLVNAYVWIIHIAMNHQW